MITISEFLKDKKNQEVVLERIIAALRVSGEWGKRGLYSKIGEKISLSPAYVGQVFAGKKALTENFMVLMSSYLNVEIVALMEKYEHDFVEMNLKFSVDVIDKIKEDMAKCGYTAFTNKDVSVFVTSLIVEETNKILQKRVELEK